jgi:hypothetical protein
MKLMENFVTNHSKMVLSKRISFSWAINCHRQVRLCKSRFSSLPSDAHTYNTVGGQETDQVHRGVLVDAADVEEVRLEVDMMIEEDVIGKTNTIAVIIDGRRHLAPMRNVGEVCYVINTLNILLILLRTVSTTTW